MSWKCNECKHDCECFIYILKLESELAAARSDMLKAHHNSIIQQQIREKALAIIDNLGTLVNEWFDHSEDDRYSLLCQIEQRLRAKLKGGET